MKEREQSSSDSDGTNKPPFGIFTGSGKRAPRLVQVVESGSRAEQIGQSLRHEANSDGAEVSRIVEWRALTPAEIGPLTIRSDSPDYTNLPCIRRSASFGMDNASLEDGILASPRKGARIPPKSFN